MRTRLKQFRVGLHLTQAEFAAKIGVCRATYSFIERGIRSGTNEFWANIQRVFDVPDEEMYVLMKLDESEDEPCGTNEK